MKKKLIVAAIAATLVTPLIANAEAIMYGEVRVATQYHSRENVNDSWGLADQLSRLGVKGEEDLGNGLKAIFKLEFGVDVGTGYGGKNSSWGGNFLDQRNSYVGLNGAFGTILAGRHDTPMKVSTNNLDLFRDTNVDNDTNFGGNIAVARRSNAMGIGLFDSLRVDGAVAYISPSLAGVTLMGAAVQTAAYDNTFNNADDAAGAYSLAATYSNGPWYASGAFESLSSKSLGYDTEAPDYDKWRLGIGMLNFNNISASFIYEDRTDTYFVEGMDTSSWQLSAAYDIMGMFKVKGTYGEYDGANDLGNSSFNTWAIGFEHNLSKRTDVQVLYRQKEMDNEDQRYLGQEKDSDNVFAVQLDHAF